MFGRLVLILTSASLFLAACGGGSSSPTPTAPTTPTVIGLTVSGTAGLTSKGQTSQLTATATMSSGATQGVTAQATWQSSNTVVATVSAAGVVTAAGDGEAMITATYQGQSGQMKVTVTVPTRAIADVSLVLKAYTPGGSGLKYRWENTYTFKETGGVYGYTMTSFRIDYYDQNGAFVIAQAWDAVNIALALGSGGRIAPSASKDWAVNWNTNAAVTRVRADYQGTARDDVGNAVTIQGSQSVNMPAAAAVK
ncbi:MAG: Ig-like domain-containing protein [Acidobacteria bacterium]|nr:Ig-like domain-containing protein [Planctomycetota bacterium]MBE3132874.1 Ig-like domain-containing protein [Acidobacteriota bacterium]